MNPTTVEELCNIGFSPNGCPSFGELKNAIDLMACGLNALSGSEPDTDLTWTYAPQDPNDQDNNNTLATQIDKDGNPTGQTYVLNNSFAITDFDQDTDADGVITTTITHTPADGSAPVVTTIVSGGNPLIDIKCRNNSQIVTDSEGFEYLSNDSLRQYTTILPSNSASFDQTTDVGVVPNFSGTRTITLPECGGRLIVDYHHAYKQIQSGTGFISVRPMISFDGGATFVFMATGGQDEIWINESQEISGEFHFTDTFQSQILSGTVDVVVQLDININTLAGGAVVQNTTHNLYTKSIDKRCC